MRGNLYPVVIAIIIGIFVISSGCTDRPVEKVPVKVVAAGSLLVPLADAEARYEALHPEIDIQVEGHGSIQAIRQVTEINRPFDVVAVADESLIPDLMYCPVQNGEGNYTDWYTTFARNEMVIAYTANSRYHDEITRDNWYHVLSRPDVRVGFSNPMLDAAGYRALLVTMLAGEEYQDWTIFSRVIGDYFDPPLVVENEDDIQTVRLPQVLKPLGNKIAVRDGSVFLMSLLEAGGIDYAFEYRSVAEAQGVPYIILPDTINLGTDQFNQEYHRARVILGFPRFSVIGSERTGMPILYAATIPSTAVRVEEAREFLEFFLSEVQKGGRGWPEPLDTPHEFPWNINTMAAGG
ncbi:MAG: Molybdate/tungstate-binding protein WtpA precursor [Methanoregulaceae archaeon PtaB.Bin056]|jgi:molybdate/tungstate transport system substrate-binding protein|nr:MAG: Molybdate/tungstate-binding protein WtpA precursor [Methanoregulaceae archaeon PtaB.Bin056]